MKYRIVKEVDGNDKEQFFVEEYAKSKLWSLWAFITLQPSLPEWERAGGAWHGGHTSFSTQPDAEHYIRSMHITKSVVKEIEL